MEKNWSMNETQKEFVEIVKGNPDGITLFELKLQGKEFKTGSINPLLTKGILEIAGEKEFACEITYQGVAVGKVTKKAKIYKLVSND